VAANLDFSNSAGVAVDSLGNLYIADTNNHRIRKVTPAGMISTIVGTGIAGYSGDGGPAAEAQIYMPHGVEIDASGNLYIADTWNSRIRKVTPAGVITTVTGTGTSGFSGDGGPATLARLSYPKDITLDAAGNLYIADYTNHRVRKVTLAGIISTVAGMGRSGFSGDGGPATAAQLDHPTSIALDAAGNLYISDSLNHRIRKVADVAAPSTYFPQVAVGGGYTTVFTFGNSGSDMLSGTLELMDQQGNPLVATGTVDNPGIPTVRLTGSLFTILIPPGGVGFVAAESAGVQDPVNAGWAQVDYAGGSLYSVATLQQSSSGVMQNAIGVLPSAPLPYATIPVDYSVYEARRVGYALANPGGATISITISLVDQSGIVTNDGLNITLGPGHQIARYLDQDLGRTHFKGSVVLQGKDGATFVGLALMENQGRLSVIPVVPLQAPNIPD
jgi:sugar lactone lactonase YvrE